MKLSNAISADPYEVLVKKIADTKPPRDIACMTTFVRYNISYNFFFGPNPLSLTVLEISP